LLQELTMFKETGIDTAQLDAERIFEKPVHRISRRIQEDFWRGLVRRIDERGLPALIRDDKVATEDGRHYLYVPSDDAVAASYFSGLEKRHPDWNLSTVVLPPRITPEYVRDLKGRHGLLTLGLRETPSGDLEGEPFIVPGGRFNEMYGWDSYFIVLGLLKDGRVDIARSIVENCIYEIRHYGAILNANRTYYLTRSQPPFLTSMAIACYGRLPRNRATRKWIAAAMEAAIAEYRNVWMNADHLTSTGLSRYFDSGTGAPPEVEPGHYDQIFEKYAKRAEMPADRLKNGYESGSLHVPELDAYFKHDRAMRESGHDSSYRLVGCCADLVTVDLNSLLYKIESDIASILSSEFGGELTLSNGSVESAAAWKAKAEERKALMNRYLWNPTQGMFFDYDFVRGTQTTYLSATAFYPLWSGLATGDQARRLLQAALPLLETAGGVAGSSLVSRGPVSRERPQYQWDYPFGWAPHQMLLWQGLMDYGYDGVARRLAYKWLYTMTLNAVQYNGTIPEKFDVELRTHEVFAEYGNVGTTFSYITREGFGWTNASYEVGLNLLPPELIDALNRLVPPEWEFLAEKRKH
ncbi:MAG TPA: trehalase family glycosidase, partial [Bacteroidota bacterium]|nr:trehalase family glycosidase [Bacteroidota bacterium]